jgi:ATP-dependent Clp protease ATP-binding subunit ClpA
MNWFRRLFKGQAAPQAQMDRVLPPVIDGGVGNFTPRAQQVLALARREADRFHHNFVGTEHLLLGLIRQGQGTAVVVLGRLGVDLETARREVEKIVGGTLNQEVHVYIPYTPRVKKVLALAAKEARALNHTYVGTEHILLGLLAEGDGVAGRVLKNLGVDIENARVEILRELDPNYQGPAAVSATEEPKKTIPVKEQQDLVDTSKRYDVYCVEGVQEVVYRNVLFKGRKCLLKTGAHDLPLEFLELEEADGQRVFVAATSVVKFRESAG